MNDILVENQFGHGANQSSIRRVFNRVTELKVGKAAIPFDWQRGFRLQDKIGIIPKKNQGQSSSCGGQAASYFVGSVSSWLNSTPYVEVSAKSIYSPIAYPGGGTTPGALQNQLKKVGATREVLVPSYENGQIPSEKYMTDISWEANKANLIDAMDRDGWRKVNVKLDIESFAEAIKDFGAVIMEITGQNNGTWLSNNPQPPSSKQNNWNHFMCTEGAFLRGGVKTISAFQSWGEYVGDKGIQYFNDNYFASGYIIDAFTFTQNTYYQYTSNFGYGTTSDDVRELQIRLGVTPTSYFGWMTFIAVIGYQVAHGITPTGYVGVLTRASLNQA